MSTQKLVFQAFLGDDYIGTMIVTKTEDGETVDYRAVTDITVTYLISVDLDLSYRAFYRGDALEETAFEYQRGHRIKEQCRGQRRGANFVTQRDEELTQVAYATIQQSLMASYFNEPTRAQAIFSERWGRNIPLQRLAANRYKLTLPDGKESFMTYRNGLCQESRIVSRWGTIVFRR
ncbi:MAG: hypothetical protein D6772_13930 [Bacteroidetes bacterium]|nr:MAG: hypothetical protein D6772_13930 [Bacteroidota bacterium]